MMSSKFDDKLSGRNGLKGKFFLQTLDADGNVVETYVDDNLIVNGGRDAIVKLIGGSGADKNITQIAFGTDGANPIITNTSLTTQFAKNVDGTAYPATETVEFSFSLATGEYNGNTIREFGLLCADGTLFARKIRAAIEKTVAISLSGTWSITF